MTSEVKSHVKTIIKTKVQDNIEKSTESFDTLIDVGVNFSSKQFEHYHDEYLQHCIEAGVGSLICITNSRKEWTGSPNSNLPLLDKYKDHQVQLYTTLGIHPHSASQVTTENAEQTWSDLRDMAQLPRVVAIGECGLDYNRMFSKKEKQIEVFRRQIEIAIECKKPLYLHDRDASEDVIRILKEYQKPKESKEQKDQLIDQVMPFTALVHCFTGNRQTMQTYLDMGFYIGITGWICDTRRNQDLVDAVKVLPLERLLIETDAPWLTPLSYQREYQTKRNESDALAWVIEDLAYYTGYTEQQIREHSVKNSRALFHL